MIPLRCCKDIVSTKGNVIFTKGKTYDFQEFLWQIIVKDDLDQTHEIRGSWDESLIEDHFEDIEDLDETLNP